MTLEPGRKVQPADPHSRGGCDWTLTGCKACALTVTTPFKSSSHDPKLLDVSGALSVLPSLPLSSSEAKHQVQELLDLRSGTSEGERSPSVGDEHVGIAVSGDVRKP